MEKVTSRMGWIVLSLGVLVLSMSSFAESCPLIWSYSIDGITALSVSESGNFVAVGCVDGWYYIFDTFGNRMGSGHVADAVISLDIADTGDLIVGFSDEYTFCTMDGTQISSSGCGFLRNVSMSSDGSFSLACCQNDLFINRGTHMVQQFDIPSDFLFGVVSADGSLACAASDEFLYIFDNNLNSWAYPGEATYEKDEEIKHLFVSSNGKKITFSTATKIGYIDMEAEEVQLMEVGIIQNMAASPSGDITVFSTGSNLVWLREDIVNELAISDIQVLLVTDDGLTITGNDNQIQIMTMDGTSLFTYDFECPILDLQVSSQGDLLVVCTETSVYTFQLFQEMQTNTHVISPASRKSLPLTSPLEEVWSIPVEENARFFTADMDGDGLAEILLCEKPKLKLFDGNGTLLAERDLDQTFGINYLLDVDGDTICEIPLELHSERFVFAVYDWDKDAIREYNLDSLGEDPLRDAETQPLAVISDDDGTMEILASYGVGYSCKPRGVVSVNAVSGEIEWLYRRGTTPFTHAVADIDGDGSVEIVLGCMAPCTCPDDEEYPDCEGLITVLSDKGEKLWEVHTGYGFQRISVSVADIHEYEGTEIIGYGFDASETWGSLFILTCDGKVLYNREFDYAIIPGAVADIDGDGIPEIVTANSRGYLTIFSGDLQEKTATFVVDDVSNFSKLYVNDFDGDGSFEIFLNTKSELFIFDKDLNIIWRKEYPALVWYGIANFSQCKNTLLVLSDRLYAYTYKETGEVPCPLWEITERTLTEEGEQNFKIAESLFNTGEYRSSKPHYEIALDRFSSLENEEKMNYISDKIEIINPIIFRQNVRIGVIFLGLFDGFLSMFLLYYWSFKRIWSHLGEEALLLSLPVLLGLFQVQEAGEKYLQVFVTYAVPSLIGSGVLIFRQNILGFLRTIAATLSGHKDMLVLSITESNGSYRVSVESIEEKFNPVKESREVVFPQERKETLVKKVDFMTGILSQYSSATVEKSLDYTENILRETGTEIYKSFIPDDFSGILEAKFLMLEVEDTEIPWELMYSDEFFAVKYAISRRVVTTEPVNVRHKSRKRGRKALVISDPTETLSGASLECDIVYKRLRQKMNTTLVKGLDANVRRIANLFGKEFDIIHFAGHVENGLVLSDGVMSSNEVKEFIAGRPVVFVNGCKSEDLARAFLLGGAITYVGTIHPVHDKSAAGIAADFYDFCLQYQIGEALRRARELHRDKGLAWASLIMYGDPTLKLL